MKQLFVLLLLATILLFADAWNKKRQFYPMFAYSWGSSLGATIISSNLMTLSYLMWKMFCILFVGDLHIEGIEQINWFAVMEACIPFAAVGTKISPKFLVLFLLFLLVMSLHTMAEIRIDYIERNPLTLSFHFRTAALMFTMTKLESLLIELAMNGRALKGLNNPQQPWQLVFMIEYSILSIESLRIIVKYILHCTEIIRSAPWNDKYLILLQIDVVSGILKICVYTFSCVVIYTNNLYPVFLWRPAWDTFNKVVLALKTIWHSRRAIRNMNTIFVDATNDDILNFDDVCTICREEHAIPGESKVLPCRHIFHTACLRMWFLRQQNCPTCRSNILASTQ